MKYFCQILQDDLKQSLQMLFIEWARMIGWLDESILEPKISDAHHGINCKWQSRDGAARDLAWQASGVIFCFFTRTILIDLNIKRALDGILQESVDDRFSFPIDSFWFYSCYFWNVFFILLNEFFKKKWAIIDKFIIF